jgi:lipoic acid synthetase
MSATLPAWRPRLPAFMKGGQSHGRTPVSGAGRPAGDSAFPTVCEEALCPNRTDCWARGSLAFQILGSICTRRCSFCAETTGRPGPVDPAEPEKLVDAARRLQLKHVVITSPARDDLDDQGAAQFAACVRALRAALPEITVETLTPDFQGREDLLRISFLPRKAGHFQPQHRNGSAAHSPGPGPGHLRPFAERFEAGRRGRPDHKIRVYGGFGRDGDEVETTMRDLSAVGVRALTVGQYLPPTPAHFAVNRFYSLEEFGRLRALAQPLF